MKAWSVRSPGPTATGPLAPARREAPDSGPGCLRVPGDRAGVAWLRRSRWPRGASTAPRSC
ncbi:hypothetical protein ACFQU9_02940 [Actinomadura namibiensis]|uniref:hypothetical protein n=1 Tax=Actinomadura kijaniata TaxID=46161 RepID=UPI003610D2B3